MSKLIRDDAMDGNQMKIREALEEILLICYKAGVRYGYDVACGLIKSKAKKALSEPPRNCDVDTAEEHEVRFKRFCESHWDLNNPDSECARCPLDERVGTECEFAWEQMPYEAQEGDTE